LLADPEKKEIKEVAKRTAALRYISGMGLECEEFGQ